MKAKKFILVKHFEGFPKEDNLKLVEEELAPIKNGEALFEAVYLSVDPYMRGFSEDLPTGSVMLGEQLARVIESKNSKYPVGQHVLGDFGWRTHTVASGKSNTIKVVTESHFKDLSLSLSLGILGMTGATAHLALSEIGKPLPGETVLVSAAAGAVGSVVGQIAKLKGCNVIGCAGTKAKCNWLRELGFDEVFNYKTRNLTKALSEVAPDGVDIYFDNVGGDFTSTVIEHHMRTKGRVIIVGGISTYNDVTPRTGVYPFNAILANQLLVQGFEIFDTPAEKCSEAHRELAVWIKEGKLKYKGTLTEGFENMYEAFLGLFKGDNIGKAVIKV